MDGRLSITEVAKFIGVTPRTIMRWEKTGKIKRSKRDWRGWRFYIKDDLEDIRRFYESTYEYNEGGKNIMNNVTKVTVAIIIAFLTALATSIIGGSNLYAEPGISQSGAVAETKTSVNINLANLQPINTPPATVSEAIKYTLGPDDVIEIEVRRHPEFSGQYVVNSEGKIEYKFVGDVIVNGLTKAQVQERLAGILSEYIVDPDVNVRILSYMSKVVYVVGEVAKPGKFYMKGDTITLREVLVQSGLPTSAASTRKCRIIRPSDKGKSESFNVNVYELLYAGDLRENKDMKPGDVLYVPSTIIAKIIRVVSPVTNAVSEAAGSVAAGAGMAAVAL